MVKHNSVHELPTIRFLVWLVAVSILATLLALITIAISDNPTPSQDLTVMKWIVGWDLWDLTTFFDVGSAATGAQAGVIYGGVGIIFLLLLGKNRPAIVFTAVGVTTGSVAVLGDYTLGEFVDRRRPLETSLNPTPAFPSGHVFGSTVFFGFMGFLSVYYQMKRKILMPTLAIFIIVLVGPALRVPPDVL